MNKQDYVQTYSTTTTNKKLVTSILDGAQALFDSLENHRLSDVRDAFSLVRDGFFEMLVTTQRMIDIGRPIAVQLAAAEECLGCLTHWKNSNYI